MTTSSAPPGLAAGDIPTEAPGFGELAGLFEELTGEDLAGGELPDSTSTADSPGAQGVLAPISPERMLAEIRAVPPAPATVRIDTFIQECVTIEPIALTEEFARLPADFARWNEVYAVAHERYLKAKLHAARTRATAALNIRRNPALYAQAYKVPKLTEGIIESILALDADVQVAEDVVVHAETERNRVRGVLIALGRKNDALVTIGAHQRAEMSNANGMRGGPGWVGQSVEGLPRRGTDR